MKIAHISDFHLRHYLEGDDVRCGPDLITEAARHIAAHAPDLVAVTGDLVDYPLDALDDPDTVALGKKDLLLVRECFDSLSCPVAYVYGNHDHPASFRRVFSDQLSDFDVEGFRVVTFFDEEGDHYVPRRVGEDRARFLSVLSDGDPRIEMFTHENGVEVMPYMMEQGEYVIVARRLREVLKGACEGDM